MDEIYHYLIPKLKEDRILYWVEQLAVRQELIIGNQQHLVVKHGLQQMDMMFHYMKLIGTITEEVTMRFRINIFSTMIAVMVVGKEAGLAYFK